MKQKQLYLLKAARVNTKIQEKIKHCVYFKSWKTLLAIEFLPGFAFDNPN